MNSDPPPKFLARFYGNPEYAIEVIRDQKITFVHVPKLNDPFDPYFFFETDFNESYEAIIQYVEKTSDVDMELLFKAIPPKLWSYRINSIKTFMQESRLSTYMIFL